MQNQNYLTLVRCFTYNHSAYIKDALIGFVEQKTNFPYIVVVVDDASTDGAQDIIRQFVKEQFDVRNVSAVCERETDYGHFSYARHKNNLNCYIATLFLKENHYQQRKSKLPYLKEWENEVMYHAICEGDDYWIDPLKLQKQVDFMEANPDYSMCFHEAEILNESDTPFSYTSLENREYTSDELFKNWIVPTASILLRREILSSLVVDKRILNGDINLVLACADNGRVWGMSDEMSVYRVQQNGLTISRIKQDFLGLQLGYIEHYKCLSENYTKVNPKLYKSKIADTYISLSFINIKKGKLGSAFLFYYKSLRYNPFSIVIRLINKVVK